jgi:hypothetical protein
MTGQLVETFTSHFGTQRKIKDSASPNSEKHPPKPLRLAPLRSNVISRSSLCSNASRV